MIVIADSGSTKCNWQLVDDSGSVCRVQSRGINAVLQRPDEVEALLRETFAEPVQADALHFYGAERAGSSTSIACCRIKTAGRSR